MNQPLIAKCLQIEEMQGVSQKNGEPYRLTKYKFLIQGAIYPLTMFWSTQETVNDKEEIVKELVAPSITFKQGSTYSSDLWRIYLKDGKYNELVWIPGLKPEQPLEVSQNESEAPKRNGVPIEKVEKEV